MFLEKTSSLMRNLRNTSVTVLCIGVKFNATLILLIFHSEGIKLQNSIHFGSHSGLEILSCVTY